jgi:hypothetical protein
MGAEVWIDNGLLIVSALLSFISVRTLKGRIVSLVNGFFLLFPAMLVFLNMWAHTIAVLVVNYQRYQKGTFQYSFIFYALLLLGFVGILVSGLIIHYSKKLVRGYHRYKNTLYILHLVTMTLFLPVGFINPLGFLPVMAAIVSIVTILLTKKSRINRIVLAERKRAAGFIPA